MNGALTKLSNLFKKAAGVLMSHLPKTRQYSAIRSPRPQFNHIDRFLQKDGTYRFKFLVKEIYKGPHDGALTVWTEAPGFKIVYDTNTNMIDAKALGETIQTGWDRHFNLQGIVFFTRDYQNCVIEQNSEHYGFEKEKVYTAIFVPIGVPHNFNVKPTPDIMSCDRTKYAPTPAF